MALIVKSRSPRSSSTVPRLRVTSTVRDSCTTRQAPWRSDSGNGEPPARDARPPGGRARIAVDHHVDVGDRAADQQIAHAAADQPRAVQRHGGADPLQLSLRPRDA